MHSNPIMTVESQLEKVHEYDSGSTERPTAAKADGNLIGIATSVAFIAFLVADALGSQRTAAIVFLAVLVGALGLLVAVMFLAALADRNRRERHDELLEVAILAVRMAQREAGSGSPQPDQQPATASSAADVDDVSKRATNGPADAGSV